MKPPSGRPSVLTNRPQYADLVRRPRTIVCWISTGHQNVILPPNFLPKTVEAHIFSLVHLYDVQTDLYEIVQDLRDIAATVQQGQKAGKRAPA